MYHFGELTMATVALTGIIMVLTTSNRKNQKRGGQIAMQLRMSSTVAIFSVFPLIVERFGLADQILCQNRLRRPPNMHNKLHVRCC